MCLSCFDTYISRQDAILYAHVHKGNLSTKCPYCQAANGFAYWNIIYRHTEPLQQNKCRDDREFELQLEEIREFKRILERFHPMRFEIRPAESQTLTDEQVRDFERMFERLRTVRDMYELPELSE